MFLGLKFSFSSVSNSSIYYRFFPIEYNIFVSGICTHFEHVLYINISQIFLFLSSSLLQTIYLFHLFTWIILETTHVSRIGRVGPIDDLGLWPWPMTFAFDLEPYGWPWTVMVNLEPWIMWFFRLCQTSNEGYCPGPAGGTGAITFIWGLT